MTLTEKYDKIARWKHQLLFLYTWQTLNPLFLVNINFYLSFSDLSRNRLKRIESQAFNNLSNLTYLDISYNKLPALELDYMCHLPKLQIFNISGNVQFSSYDLSSVFHNMSELRSLSIADITNLPLDIFDSLNKLESLNVSGAGFGNDTSRILQQLIMLKVCRFIGY